MIRHLCAGALRSLFFVAIFSFNINIFSEWSSTSFCFAADTPEQQALQAKIDEAKVLIRALSEKRDRELTDVVVKLGNYHFQPVARTLVYFLFDQIKQPRPNRYVVNATLDSLAGVGNALVVAEFEEVMSKWQEHFSAPLIQDPTMRIWAVQLPARFLEVRAAMARRTEALPGFGNANTFEALLQDNATLGSPEAVILSTTVEFMTDTVPDAADFVISDREAEADRAIDTLVRIKGKNPTLIGTQGSGKTTVVQRIVQKIRANEYPQDPAYMELLDGAQVIQTTPGRISRLAKSDSKSSQMTAIEQVFDAVLALEKKYEKKIIVYIDEAHTLEEAQAEAMLTYMDSQRKGISLILSATSKRFQNNFKDNEPFLRRCEQIPVEEFSREQVLKSVAKSWKPAIEKKYGVFFTAELLELVVNHAPSILPENGRFDATIKLLQDMAIGAIRAGKKGETLNEDQGYAFLRQRLNYPINPHDGRGFKAYLDQLKLDLNQDVVGQPRMIGDVVDIWGDLLQDHERGVRVALSIGPTGVGKSLMGRSIAQRVFKNPRAFFEIDGNTYKTGGLSLNSIFGTPSGTVGFDKGSGTFMDWIDDPAQGKFGGVILVNEGERAHEDFWERFMEFLDVGRISGGDGKERRANKHIVIFTSNRGDSILFPPASAQWSERELLNRVIQVSPLELKNLFVRKISGDDEFNVPVPFLNRVDVFTVAKPVLQSELDLILGKMAQSLSDTTLAEKKIRISFDPAILSFLARALYVKRDGARPVVRQVQAILKKARTEALGYWDVERDGELRCTLDASNLAHPKIKIEKQGVSEFILMDLPKPKLDPMDDPEFLDRVARLEEKMNERVFGQKQAIHSIAQAAAAHFLNPEQNLRALSVIGVSSTGVGKTETGKALAFALFDDEKRCEVISLNGIIYEGELNNILGSPVGHVGSVGKASIRQFEQFLINNPNGGVLVWDEFSNLGGKDRAQKEALIKKFYGITDEQFWTSPQTNEKYDLSKHVFLWTGNDGERLFQGITSDEVRMVVYHEHKTREEVRELLRESGVPEPFIGRMADTILWKPLVRAEAVQVVRKHLAPVLKYYEKYGIHIQVDEAFENQFAKTFFTQDEGGRSVRKVVDHRVRSILSQAVTAMRRKVMSGELTALSGLTVQLSLEDSLTPKPYVKKDAPPRKVFFNLSAQREGVEVFQTKEDVTDFAGHEPRPLYENAVVTAWHEAGHAVENDSKVTGQKTTFISIFPGGLQKLKYLGIALYRKDHEEFGKGFTRSVAVRSIARAYAGQKAQELAGYERDAGWNNDLEKIRNYARRYFLEFGLDPEFEGLLVGTTDGNITDQFLSTLSAPMRQKLEEKTKALIKEGEDLAERELVEKWDLVRAIVAKLVVQGNVSETEFNQMVSNFNAKEAQRAGPRKWELRRTEAGAPRVSKCAQLLRAS